MKGLRAHHGWNTAEAGEALGLSRRTIEGIEQGRGFSAATLLELAIAYLMNVKRIKKPLDEIR